MITKEKLFTKWIDALRSGDYKQGGGQLREDLPSGVRHCCLGVLCEVAKGEGVISSYSGINGGLPEKLAKFMDMDTLGEMNKEVNGGISLTELNDGGRIRNRQPKSFKFIATLLEKRRNLLNPYPKS